MLDEIDKHTIVVLPDDTDRNVLEKIALNLNGKTEAIAKLRRGQTAVMTEIAKMPTVEQFAVVQQMVIAHEARWKRFDDLCAAILMRFNEIWEEIKDMLKSGGRNAVILFLTVLFLAVIWKIWEHYFPGIKLNMPSPA